MPACDTNAPAWRRTESCGNHGRTSTLAGIGPSWSRVTWSPIAIATGRSMSPNASTHARGAADIGRTAVALGFAARCSAGFPVAFEPTFVPVDRRDAAVVDELRPDMGPYASWREEDTAADRSRFVVDGGVLANTPTREALELGCGLGSLRRRACRGHTGTGDGPRPRLGRDRRARHRARPDGAGRGRRRGPAGTDGDTRRGHDRSAALTTSTSNRPARLDPDVPERSPTTSPRPASS